MEVKQLAVFLTTLMVTLGSSVAAQEALTLRMPEAMRDNGFAQHLLPRFAFRSRIRISPVDPSAAAAMQLSQDGPGDAVLSDAEGHVYRLSVLDSDQAPPARVFVDWLQSDVGRAAISAFRVGDVAPYTPVEAIVAPVAAIVIDGDPVRGLDLSRQYCQRCHVVHPSKPFAGIGSTPSFAALKSMPGWQDSFAGFYAANPHRALIGVTGVTDPNHPDRPVPIAPITLTLDQINDILAYADSIEAKDLGMPVQSFQE
jgi:hypothetical protein